MFSTRSTTLYGIGLRLLTSGEGISHHLRRVRHIAATIRRHIGWIETICDEFGTFATSFRLFWGFDELIVMIGGDERRRVTIWGYIAFISGYCDKFWVDWSNCMKVWGDWRRIRDICCWFVTIAKSWNDCWSSITIAYDHYRFAMWLLYGDSEPIAGKMALIWVGCGKLWRFEASWRRWGRFCGGSDMESVGYYELGTFLWRWRRNLGDASKKKCTQKTLYLNTNYKW